MKKSKR